MEFNICDLLDDLPEVAVDIQPNTGASANRIKELTMKKIHSEKKRPRRGLSTLSKVLVAAAILASLALPVMAATGFHFTDWLEGLAKESTKAYEVRYNSWEETEGFWQVSLTAKDLTREGMTLVCREVQDSPVTGALTIHGGYRLEHWNGEAFAEMTTAGEIIVEESREIKDGDSFELAVNWKDAYGQLESGRYRLYKTFTYTYSDGRTVDLTDWAEFRIFNEDMTPFIRQCKDAMEDLLQKDSHIEFTIYEYGQSREEVIGRYTWEIWHSGENYLSRRRMDNYVENMGGDWGDLLQGDEAYEILSWVGDDVMQGADQWEYDDLLSKDLNQFDIWNFYMTIDESRVGEIWAEDNTIVVLERLSEVNSVGEEYQELTYRFDDAGDLIGGEINYLAEPWCEESEKRLNSVMVVRDTSPADIAKVIAAQNVEELDSFSWAEEREEHLSAATGVKTSGFNNTAPVTMESGYDAFMRAFNDYDVVAGTHHASHVAYDPDADMWRVEFWWANGDVNAVIYLDGDGITRMTVMGPYEE